MKYQMKLIKRFGMENAKVTKSPLPGGYHPEDNKSNVVSQRRTEFQQIIGSLLYLMLGTRPDICYAVIKMSKHMANPSQDHLDKAKYIIRYLVGTPRYNLTYKGKEDQGLIAYTDSDWASDPMNRKSISG